MVHHPSSDPPPTACSFCAAYVAANGNDSNLGTLCFPVEDYSHAIPEPSSIAVQPGYNRYVRGGTLLGNSNH